MTRLGADVAAEIAAGGSSGWIRVNNPKWRTIMGSRVIAVCDICGNEQEFKTAVPVADWSRELELEGWWQRPDFTEICPRHPKPVTSL
jgi:hypothetical protein